MDGHVAVVLKWRPRETCRPISHRSLLPAGLQTCVIYWWPCVCLCVCPCGPLPPTAPITLTTAADPNRTDLGCFVSHRSIAFTASVFLEALPPPASCLTAIACACPRAPAPRLKEHVHVSGPVKVTPYASCRDNEGFNFTTQAYQIAAPRSLRHALAT